MSSEESDSEESLSFNSECTECYLEKSWSFQERLIDFDFSYHYMIKNHQSLLLEMKQDGFFQNREPRKFEIIKPKLNDEDIGILLNVFYYFHEKGIVWERGIFHVGKRTMRFVQPLLHAVNAMNVFKKMNIRYSFYDDGEEYSDLCPGITKNTFTEEITLSMIIIVGNMAMVNCRALNNLLQTNAPCLKKLHLDTLGDFECKQILPGLSRNRTLKDLTLYMDRDVTDATTMAIVDVVTRNPNVEALFMRFSDADSVGDLSSEAFKRLLSDSTSLRELILERIFHYDLRLNAECIIQGLKSSPSLKSLHIDGLIYGDLKFARLFRILPDCPLLEYLHFCCWGDEYVLGEEDLAQVKLLPRLPRPIHLRVRRMGKNRYLDPELMILVELLRYHPEVRMSVDYDPDFLNKDNPDFWRIFHMNWHGRYLLDRPNVPLSIWPLVLEKVNHNEDVKDKASIIYELLKGPAWGGRRSFEKRVD